MAGNAAMLQNQGAANAGMLRAQEMAQARGAYGDLTGAIRGQDLQRLQISNNIGLNDANNTNAYKLGVGGVGASYGANGIGAGNTALNYAGNAMRPWEQQLGSNNQYEGLRVGTAQNTQNLRSGIAGTNRQSGMGQMNNLYKGAGATFGSASSNSVGPNTAKNSKTSGEGADDD